MTTFKLITPMQNCEYALFRKELDENKFIAYLGNYVKDEEGNDVFSLEYGSAVLLKTDVVDYLPPVVP